jgi:putative membrane protein
VTGVVWGFALLAAVLHILVFVWEALLFQRPRVHGGVFSTPEADVPAIRLWAFGVGFYNLLSRPRGTGVGGAVAQGGPPLVALIAVVL